MEEKGDKTKRRRGYFENHSFYIPANKSKIIKKYNDIKKKYKIYLYFFFKELEILDDQLNRHDADPFLKLPGWRLLVELVSDDL